MMYVGFVITVKEAVRLLKLDEFTVTSDYDTLPIQNYLKEKGSQLEFTYIDKGACAFGLHVCNSYGEKYTTLDECIEGLQETKRKFHEEIEKMKIDTREVNLTWIESEERLVKSPQGYLIDV